MKKIFYICLVVILYCNTIISQINIPDSIYLYDENHQKDWYYVQKDMFSFNFDDNYIYDLELPNYIDSTSTYSNSYSIFNSVYFSNTSTNEQREEFINDLKNYDNFKSYAWGISRNQGVEYSESKYFPTDDLIFVTFKAPNLPTEKINHFANKYNLDLVYEPSIELPANNSWTYIFQLRKNKKIESMSTIYLSNQINENETNLIKLAEPNAFSAIPFSCDPHIDELSNSPDNNNYTWYINNEGGDIFNGDIGVPDADADICECWEEGLTGQNIKTGIIDFGGFERTHPDFLDADINLYNAKMEGQPTLINTPNFYYDDDSTSLSHAMLVSGTIISQPNNINHPNGYSIGVAYNSTFYVYLCGPQIITGGSNSYIITALHQAIKDEIDVLNMSFGIGVAGTLSGQLSNAITTGRPDPNNPSNKRGMVVTAAVGNTNNEPPYASVPIFPANQTKTIGVGYSTPEDFRATTSSGEGNYSWDMPAGSGSIYGGLPYHFDVVAPGVIIRSTNLVNGQGNGYLVLSGSSLASPIVASIVALILEEKPSLTYQEVQNIIRDGAEKVNSTLNGGPYQYGNSGNGYNKKMFFGRVSCINSLNLATLLDIDQEYLSSIKIKNIDEGRYIIETTDDSFKNLYLYSLDGRLLINKSVKTESIEVNINQYPKGIYLLKIDNGHSYPFSTKLVH